jgi:hypothetical protein
VATHPLFRAGFFQGHDLILEFTRVAEYSHLLKAGVFPVRWGANLEGGYGYPIYNFFPPLFVLIASIFIIAGSFSVMSAIKSTIFLLALSAGIGMYWFAREHFGKRGGVLVACLYVLAPYHFIDVFNRNAFSEFAALAIAPFVFYGLARIAKEDKFKLSTAVLMAVSSALFVLSHNLSVAMYTPLFLTYFIAAAATTGLWKKIERISLPLALSFALTSFYTLPLLYEFQFVQARMLTIGKFNVLENLLSIGQVTGWMTVLSWLLIITSTTALVIWRRNIPRSTFAVLCAFEILLLLTVFMITPASRLVWSHLEFLKWLQFPWRLLSPATFLICFAAGAVAFIPLPNERAKSVLLHGGIALGIITLLTFSVVNRGTFTPIPDQDLAPGKIREGWLQTTALSEYLPIWVKGRPSTPVGHRLTPSRADVEVKTIEESPHRHFYKVVTTEEGWLTANLFYFPGWKVYVNGEEVKPNVSEQGLMQFHLPKGQCLVDLKFENTPVRAVGNGLSILGLLLLGILIFLAISPTQRQHFLENQGSGK